MDIPTSVILSIKPQYVNAIIQGTKKIEFRKSIFKRKINKVFIYSSSPVQRLVGYFTIADVIEESPALLWEQFKEVGGINKKDFFAYYAGKEKGIGLLIDSVVPFEKEINPKELLADFTPPQSYQYVEEEELMGVFG